MTIYTIQPSLKRGRNAWDKLNMPIAEFQSRAEMLTKQMKNEGVETLLIYGKGLGEYANPCYVSNHIPEMPSGMLVILHGNKEVALLFEGTPRDLPFVRDITWIDDVRYCNDVSKSCIAYLKERESIPTTIGFAGIDRLMPYWQLRAIRDWLSQCKIINCDHIINNLRMIKSEREQEQVRRSSRILSHAFDVVCTTHLPQRNEQTLEAVLERSAYMKGAEDFRMLLAKPLHEKWAFRPVEDMEVLPGETVIIYLAVEFERYWAEGIRTFIAQPYHFVQPHFEGSQTLCDEIIAMVKPGIQASELYWNIIHELQLRNSDDITEEYGLGQGIGLSLREFPVISGSDQTDLKPGMCLSFRLGLKDQEIGTIMTGHTVCLTEHGAEILDR